MQSNDRLHVGVNMSDDYRFKVFHKYGGYLLENLKLDHIPPRNRKIGIGGRIFLVWEAQHIKANLYKLIVKNQDGTTGLELPPAEVLFTRLQSPVEKFYDEIKTVTKRLVAGLKLKRR